MSVLLCVVDGRAVWGVTQLHGVIYIVCKLSSAIIRFDAVTHQRLTDITVRGLHYPFDIAACEHTSSVYVSDYSVCIWRVSSDGEDVKRWLQWSPSDMYTPWKLSVTPRRDVGTSCRPADQLVAVHRRLRRTVSVDWRGLVTSPAAVMTSLTVWLV